MNFRTGFFIIAFVILSLYVGPMAFAGDWRSDYTTKDGRTNCCGIKDCRETGGVSVAVGDKIIVFPGGIQTEVNVVYPSEDGRIWICTTGCAFMPGTS